MELLQLGFCSLDSRCNKPGRGGRRKRRGSGRKKIDRVSPGFDRVDRVPGGPGPGSTRRVDQVFPGQFPNGFLPPLGLVPGPGRPGPGSTRRASPGFKTLL